MTNGNFFTFVVSKCYFRYANWTYMSDETYWTNWTNWTNQLYPLFCKLYFAKCAKVCCKTYFLAILFGSIKNMQYFCTVFFMVLDLRLSKKIGLS